MAARDDMASPPYSQQLDTTLSVQRAEDIPDIPPPPYTPRANPPAETQSSSIPASRPEVSNPRASSSPSPTPTLPSFSLRNPLESYAQRKRAKEAVRKVDYYEKMYGFVPRNVMTQAEWRDARRRNVDAEEAKKKKKKDEEGEKKGEKKARATAYIGHYW
jgi:hypothetical protein